MNEGASGEGEAFFFETSGFSMWPFLKDKEKVLVKNVPPEDLRIGDIVLYRKDGLLVCHRLIRVQHKAGARILCLRADGVFAPWDRVGWEDYVGRVSVLLRPGCAVSFETARRRFLNWLLVFFAPWVAGGGRAAYAVLRRLKK